MSQTIHIMAPFIYANSADWRAIDFYLEYSKSNAVTLWSHQPPNKELKASYPIQAIKPYSGISPNLGTLIICGGQTHIGQWYELAQFDKIILYHNLISPVELYKALHRLSLNGTREVEIIYASELVKKMAGLVGKVSYHIPSAERFKPQLNTQYNQNRPFTIGRISSDSLSKHHHSDIDVYKSLVNSDIRVRIIGGTCLRPWLKNEPNISLQPTIAQTKKAAAYNNLDCFYYRVAGTANEASGNEVLEAMQSGLVVVCHRSGGYAELIKHGVNGFVFDTANKAIEIINDLKNNANLRREIGINAQKTNFLIG
jgi:glycosyltransferase involved in cell wall biosynthesis